LKDGPAAAAPILDLSGKLTAGGGDVIASGASGDGGDTGTN
jgi:hypothetical protein